MDKINLVVTNIHETYKNKGFITVEADIDPNALNFFNTLRIDVKKGDLEVGDKLELTVKKVK